jgi:hypothetical protein
VNYKFEGDAQSINKSDRLKLQIAVTNKGVIMEPLRKKVQDKANKDTKGVSLASFYRQKETNDKLGAGLGLYYLSYLQKACVQEKIIMDARIIPDNTHDKTYVMIYLHL